MEVWDADNIDRINPVYVEGAEDVYGAEESDADLVGQGDEGLVIGQAAEGCIDCGSPTVLNAEGGHDCGCGTEEVMAAESFDINSAFLHDAEGDSESWAVEVHSSDGGVFLAEVDTGLILHNNSSFSAEDDTPLSAEEINTILSIAAESEGTPIYSFNAEYDPTEYSPDNHNPTIINPITEPHEAEDIVDVFQEVSPFQMSGWVASALVIGSAFTFGKLMK
jgi:hypothetical protein